MKLGIQNYWVFGLFSSSGVPETRKRFGNWICFRQVRGNGPNRVDAFSPENGNIQFPKRFLVSGIPDDGQGRKT
jgi:hypothetical protein